MSKFICEINGVRGRSIEIYDNKCVISTDITLGSVITNNATDGEKTIFYTDVCGVQFKESGLTVGFLQLETAGSQMNNLSSNFFSENSFTFEGNNDYMRRVYEFVVSRVEGYKYGTIDESLTEIPRLLEKERLRNERKMREQQLLDEEYKKRESEKQDAENKLKEMLHEINQEGSIDNMILSYVNTISGCATITEMLKLWRTIPEEKREPYSAITVKLENSAKNERLYGKDTKNIENLTV